LDDHNVDREDENKRS